MTTAHDASFTSSVSDAAIRTKFRFIAIALLLFQCRAKGDILQWDQSNKNYLRTHGVSGVDWRFFKHPLPERGYDT